MKKILTYFLILFISLSPLTAQSPITEERMETALQKGGDEVSEDEEFYSQLMNIVFALAFIVFLMIVAAYYLRKFMQGRMEQINVTSTIKILEQRNLSAKTVLYIVEAHGKQILVGESVAGVVALGDLPSKRSFEEVYEQGRSS